MDINKELLMSALRSRCGHYILVNEALFIFAWLQRMMKEGIPKLKLNPYLAQMSLKIRPISDLQKIVGI